MTRCTICNTLIQRGDPTESCPECAQDYHAGCWTEIGGCATYGCPKAPEAQKAPPPAQTGGGWGDEKTCPSCHRPVASSLLRCRCGARFPYADPMTPEEWKEWSRRQRDIGSARKTLVLLFIFTLLGLPAPVLGPIAGFYAWSRRHLLAGADGTYLAMGYGAAALGVTYLLILVPLVAGL